MKLFFHRKNKLKKKREIDFATKKIRQSDITEKKYPKKINNNLSEWILQKQMELTSFGQFSSIDENAILFHSPPTFENGSKMLRNSNRNKSPALSDLNPAPPISLPDLRPVSH